MTVFPSLFPSQCHMDTCYYLFFSVLITDVLMLSLGRLARRGFHLQTLFFFGQWWETSHLEQMLVAGYPMQLLVKRRLLQGVLVFLQFLGWQCLFLIPVYGDKAGGTTSFSVWLCFRNRGLILKTEGLFAGSWWLAQKRAKRVKRLTPKFESKKGTLC